MVSPNNFGSVNFFCENPDSTASLVYTPSGSGILENGQRRQ